MGAKLGTCMSAEPPGTSTSVALREPPLQNHHLQRLPPPSLRRPGLPPLGRDVSRRSSLNLQGFATWIARGGLTAGYPKVNLRQPCIMPATRTWPSTWTSGRVNLTFCRLASLVNVSFRLASFCQCQFMLRMGCRCQFLPGILWQCLLLPVFSRQCQLFCISCQCQLSASVVNVGFLPGISWLCQLLRGIYCKRRLLYGISCRQLFLGICCERELFAWHLCSASTFAR